jgi:hypothetical protein
MTRAARSLSPVGAGAELPEVCPNDGELSTRSPGGVWFCPYDGLDLHAGLRGLVR